MLFHAYEIASYGTLEVGPGGEFALIRGEASLCSPSPDLDDSLPVRSNVRIISSVLSKAPGVMDAISSSPLKGSSQYPGSR